MLRRVDLKPGTASPGQGVEERRAGRTVPSPPFGLAPTSVLDLQRSAGNQAVGRLLQRVTGGDPKLIGTRVKDKDGNKGTILGFKPKNKTSYEVKFDDGSRRYVMANQLTSIGDPTAPSLTNENRDAPAPDESGDGPTTGKPAVESDEDAKAYQPVKLTVQPDGSRWTLSLLTAGDVEVGTLTVPSGAAKEYVNNSFLEGGPAKPQAGSWQLKPDAVLKGSLLVKHNAKVKALRKGRESEKLFKELQSKVADASGSNTAGDGSSPPDQGAVFEHLRKLNEQASPNEKGHPTVKMTKIRLLNPLTFSVRGADRKITHLYTQSGNERELRCYVGNDKGAYQRVHTSITNDGEKRTSHTMVQTGARIAVPGWRREPGATRIGFDAAETDPPGFGNRELTIRNKAQSTVKNKAREIEIQGQDAEDLTSDEVKDAMALAQRFNQLLDAAIVDVCEGDPKRRGGISGITDEFAVLDDEWDAEPQVQQPKAAQAEPKAQPKEENLASLHEDMLSHDEDLNRSVAAHPGVDKVLKEYDLTYISGEKWLCFVRCILVHLGRGDGDTMVQVHRQLAAGGWDGGLTALASSGVETNSELAKAILAAIANVTGVAVRITSIVPRSEGAPLIERSGEGEEVHLLHTGAHFTLATPKKT